MTGLNTDPASNANYSSIDYALYTRGDGIVEIYESSTSIATYGSYAANDEFKIEYSGNYIRYYKNGILLRDVYRTVSGKLYIDSSFWSGGNIYAVEIRQVEKKVNDSYKLNGYSYTSYEGYYFTDINTTNLNVNTWYPVLIQLTRGINTNIKIEGYSSGNTSSWGGRGDSQKCLSFSWTTNSSNYGWCPASRVIWKADFGSGCANSNCVAGIGQGSQSGLEYVYVRGGSHYYFYINKPITPILKTESYSDGYNTYAPTTTSPTPITRTNAIIGDYCAGT